MRKKRNGLTACIKSKEIMLVKSTIKDIQSLAGKKQRDLSGRFLLEGPKLVQELLNDHRSLVLGVFALESWVENNQELLKEVSLTIVSEAELSRLSQLSTPNQVLAIAKQIPATAASSQGKITLVCCGIQDPGNLGTIIRIADWFGVSQLVCSEDTADLYNPKVVQATMGSIFRVQLHYTHLETWLQQQQGVSIYATMLEGVDVTKMNPVQEGILLIGNESKGIPLSLIELSQFKISIPGKGRAESLNAAVATGIILSHFN